MSKRKPKQREWIVTLDVEYSGATALITAATEEEAEAKAKTGDFEDEIDISCAETINLKVNRVRENL